MKQDTVRVPSIEKIYLPKKDVYDLKIKNKFWRWVFSKLVRFKIVEPYVKQIKKTSFSTITIDFYDLEERILNHMRAIDQYYHPEEIEFIIMGYDSYMNFARLTHSMSLNFPIDNDLQPKLSFRGIEIRVIPWVEDILIVPKGR